MKKCIICGEKALYKIKDNSDFYCADCAMENFGDLSMLEKIEAEAQRLKAYIKERMHDVQKNSNREDTDEQE